MKWIIRINILFFAAIFLFSASGCAEEKTVRVEKLENGAWQLLVEGKPYFVKGVVFNPGKIGEGPGEATLRDWMDYDDNYNGLNDIAFESWVDENKNNRRDASEPLVGDFGLLKRMGVNTIRLYHVPSDNPILGNIYKNNSSTKKQYDHAVNKELLRKLYNDYGIRMIMGNFLGSWTIGSGATWDEGTDYTNPEHRENIKKSVRAMVLDNKDEPYVLMWMLGNENNIATWSRCNAKTQPEAYATLVGEIAEMIHALDPNHPVALCEGDAGNVNTLPYYAKHAQAVDILGFNSYRGPHGFDFLWKQARRGFDRPIIITEFGIFAYNNIDGENEDQQLNYLKGCWKDILKNSATCIGGTIFDWIDRWYMDGEPSRHNEGTKYWSFSPDHRDHEEWFGLLSMGNGSDTLMRQPRKAYSYFQEIWNQTNV